nr:MAG TPA: hypothetical protein [Crassvirales sp.]
MSFSFYTNPIHFATVSLGVEVVFSPLFSCVCSFP